MDDKSQWKDKLEVMKQLALGSHGDVMAFATPPKFPEPLELPKPLKKVKVCSIVEKTNLISTMLEKEVAKETVEVLSPREKGKHCLLIGHLFVPIPMVEERTSDGRTLNEIAGKKYQCEKCKEKIEEYKAWNCAAEQCGIVACGGCKGGWESNGERVETGACK